MAALQFPTYDLDLRDIGSLTFLNDLCNTNSKGKRCEARAETGWFNPGRSLAIIGGAFFWRFKQLINFNHQFFKTPVVFVYVQFHGETEFCAIQVCFFAFPSL